MPTIGCAKRRLIGSHEESAPARGSSALLMDEGAVLGTQDAIRPIYVSVGHRFSLETACAWTLRLSPTYRLPETTRAADHAARLALAEG